MRPLQLLIMSAVLFVTALGACNEVASVDQNQQGAPSVNTAPGISFLALGDSYTIGQNVSADQRWPVLFAKDARTLGKNLPAADIIATTGWTTADLLRALNANPPSKKYDIVSLLIGVNNQYQGQGLDQYRKEFRELLLKGVTYANGDAGKVFVLSVPDWGVTPYGVSNKSQIGKEIDMFNQVGKEECAKLQILFIDITPISRKAFNDPTMVASDGLHFSGKMHQLWVDKVLPEVKNKF